MLLVHEPVKLRKNKNKNTYIPLLTLEECTLGSAYGFIMAAILKLLSQDSIELAGLGAAASPSNGCGPSNDVLEECYFLLCWFGALRKKLSTSSSLCLPREIQDCKHHENTVGM